MAVGADFQFNVSLGREVELYSRVDSNDPANAVLVMAILALAGLEDSEVLRDKDDMAAIVSGTTNWVTNTGYSPKTLNDAALAAYVVDDTFNWITLVLPVQTFATISAGDTWAMVVIGYDPDSTSGTSVDSSVIPISAHALNPDNGYVVPNGGDIDVDFSGGFIRARQR